MIVNLICLMLGCTLGLFITCAVVSGHESYENRPLQKHELIENEWYWNNEHKKYYQIADGTEVNYVFNGKTNENCVYVNENEYIKPVFYNDGVWFKYRGSEVD